MGSPYTGRPRIFQSTLPQGERRSSVRPVNVSSPISIHAPTRGATLEKNVVAALAAISIHAPTRGATGSISPGAWFPPISIHAPTRGATFAPYVYNIQFAFQSTLPQGERHTFQTSMSGQGTISIHAPTRGATAWSRFCGAAKQNFNPRSHKGSDGSWNGTTTPPWGFQSTLPQGERQKREYV